MREIAILIAAYLIYPPLALWLVIVFWAIFLVGYLIKQYATKN